MDATTLPTLLLGCDASATDSAEDVLARWERAVRLPGLRGLIIGRRLLYPADGDVAAAVDTAVGLVR